MSEAEEAAIAWLKAEGGSVMQYRIEPKNRVDALGSVIPGMAVFRKLDRKGLVVICEPLIGDDGFEWSASIDLIC